MKTFIPLLFAYIITCVIAVLIPASEGYNTIGWKLFVGQLYAIPAFIIVAMITIILNKKRAVRGYISLKSLKKSSKDKALFGVCGGIAQYFGISSFLVRLISIFVIPASFWVYLILNLALKEKRTI